MNEENPLEVLLSRLADRDEERGRTIVTRSEFEGEHEPTDVDVHRGEARGDDQGDDDVVDAIVVEPDHDDPPPISEDARVPASTDVDGPASPKWRRLRRSPVGHRRDWIAVVALFAVLAVGGVVLAVVTRPSSTTRTVSASGVPPRGPNTAIYDRFDRADSATLGQAETGQAWKVVGAPFGVQDGQVFITKADSAKRTVAIIGLGTSNGSVQATMTKIAAGNGIVFRYHDAFNFWALTAAPTFATWNLQKVVDGITTKVGNVGTTATADGTVIRVRFQDDHIAVDVNGVEQTVFVDNTFVNERTVGILGVAEDTRPARWDNFVAAISRQASSSTTSPSTPTSAPNSSAAVFGN
jgi:hypothetical protein